MDLTDSEFQALYGAWQPLSIASVRDLLPGLRWWVVGGWALELATGVRRHHEDLDIAIPRTSVEALAAQLADYHLWIAHAGSLTPLAEVGAMPEDRQQLWLRKNASSPWLLDILLQPIDGDEWVFKRDRSIRVPMSEAVHVTDGVGHLAPELVLLHKAHLCRPKDDVDLAATLPHLEVKARSWLADAVRRAVPDSPWNARLADS